MDDAKARVIHPGWAFLILSQVACKGVIQKINPSKDMVTPKRRILARRLDVEFSKRLAKVRLLTSLANSYTPSAVSLTSPEKS
jgi:hypothetical protein